LKKPMTKEEFLYQFLIEYNKHERATSANMYDYWHDKCVDSPILYAFRNTLCHYTEESLKILEDFIQFERVLEFLKSLNIDNVDKFNIINFVLQSTNIESKLSEKGFVKYISDIPNNQYFFFEKKNEGLFCTIFLFESNNLRKSNKFLTISISSYCQATNEACLLDNKYYIKTSTDKEFIHFGISNKSKISGCLSPSIYFDTPNGNHCFSKLQNIIYNELSRDRLITHRFVPDCANREQHHKCLDAFKSLIIADFPVQSVESIIRKANENYCDLKKYINTIGLSEIGAFELKS